MVKYAAAGAVAGLFALSAAPRQTSACGPTATLSEAHFGRHRAAIQVARQINTAESRVASTTKRYAGLPELTGVTVPDGFQAQVSTDGTSYTFSVKDSQDQCKFAVFSDQNGLI
jgi:hypothetical protein